MYGREGVHVSAFWREPSLRPCGGTRRRSGTAAHNLAIVAHHQDPDGQQYPSMLHMGARWWLLCQRVGAACPSGAAHSPACASCDPKACARAFHPISHRHARIPTTHVAESKNIHALNTTCLASYPLRQAQLQNLDQADPPARTGERFFNSSCSHFGRERGRFEWPRARVYCALVAKSLDPVQQWPSSAGGSISSINSSSSSSMTGPRQQHFQTAVVAQAAAKPCHGSGRSILWNQKKQI